MLITTDKQGRQFRNLRISLTAACNYACTYCVPNGKRLHKAKLELDTTEFIKAISYLIEAAGIDKLRITGGEPLISSKFDDFILQVGQLPLTDISLTTNGQFLQQKLPTILKAGLKRINISLDTLDANHFRSIARSGDLASVLNGIQAAKNAGLKIKINMVPLRQSNLQQIIPMLDYCLENALELRYIELMRMGHLKTSNEFQNEFIGMQEILDLIGQRYQFIKTNAPYDSTAQRFSVLKDEKEYGVFGVIANESAPFCKTCSRLRLSSTGKLYGCLSNGNNHYITPILSYPKPKALQLLKQVLNKAMLDKQPVAFQGESTVMKMIGG